MMISFCSLWHFVHLNLKMPSFFKNSCISNFNTYIKFHLKTCASIYPFQHYFWKGIFKFIKFTSFHVDALEHKHASQPNWSSPYFCLSLAIFCIVIQIELKFSMYQQESFLFVCAQSHWFTRHPFFEVHGHMMQCEMPVHSLFKN